MFVAILIAWNLPILRDLVAGLKVSTERFTMAYTARAHGIISLATKITMIDDSSSQSAFMN